MTEYNVIVVDEDGAMQDMSGHRWLSTAVQDAQEYAELYPMAHIGIYRGIENVAQYFPDKKEWWIKTGSTWEKAEPEYLNSAMM